MDSLHAVFEIEVSSKGYVVPQTILTTFLRRIFENGGFPRLTRFVSTSEYAAGMCLLDVHYLYMGDNEMLRLTKSSGITFSKYSY